MKVTPFKPAKTLKSWTYNIIDPEPFEFLTVKDGKSVGTGVMGVLVLGTKGKRTTTHGASFPKGWDKRYHGTCRVIVRRLDDGSYTILRCI